MLTFEWAAPYNPAMPESSDLPVTERTRHRRGREKGSTDRRDLADILAAGTPSHHVVERCRVRCDEADRCAHGRRHRHQFHPRAVDLPGHLRAVEMVGGSSAPPHDALMCGLE